MAHISVVTTRRSVFWLSEHAAACGERFRCKRDQGSWVKFVPLMMRAEPESGPVSHQYVHLPVCDCDPAEPNVPRHGSPVRECDLVEITIFDELETDTPHLRKAA